MRRCDPITKPLKATFLPVWLSLLLYKNSLRAEKMVICWLVQIQFCWMCVKSQIPWEIKCASRLLITCITFVRLWFVSSCHVGLRNNKTADPQLHPGPTDITCTAFKSVHRSPRSALVCWASSPLRWSLSWHPLPQDEQTFHSSHTLMRG